MLSFDLKKTDLVEKACEAIYRGETFSVCANGFRGKMVKNLWPPLRFSRKYENESPNPPISSYFCFFWTKRLISIYLSALDEGMSGTLEEHGSRVCVVFKKDEEGQRLKEEVKKLQKERKSLREVLWETMVEFKRTIFRSKGGDKPN